MNMKSDNYNLLEEKWIPVLRSNGKFDHVGIYTALNEADRIRCIAAGNPMDRMAILRFLLALLYWCMGNPPDKMDKQFCEGFPADWLSKLFDKKDCFNLLSQEKRFYQYQKLNDKKLTSNYLIHEIPTGTNLWHFRHSTDAVNGLCPACCAMGLLRLPLFSTSGGRGKPPGINAKPPIYVLPFGKSLAETLRLSWSANPNLGEPAWVRPDLKLPVSGQVPLLTGLTWLPRRVWLSNPETSEAHCISCGRMERLILSCVFEGLGSTKTDDGAPTRMWKDPHVIYEPNSKGDMLSLHNSSVLDAADAAANQWARITAGVIRRSEPDKHKWVWIIGFSTVKNDKYLEAIEFLAPLSGLEQHQESIEKLERWQDQCKKLSNRLVHVFMSSGEKSSSRKHNELLSILNTIRPQVETVVFNMAPDLVTGCDEAWQLAAKKYQQMIKMAVHSLVPGFTTASIQKRKQIENVFPDMTISEKLLSDRKKGGKN